jgi:hypothetical protein
MYKPFGKQIKVASGDPSKTPQIQEVTMPQKTDSKGNLVDQTEADLSYIEKIKLNEQIKIQAQHELMLAADLASLYNFIFRRCTKFLQDKIKAHSRYTAADDASDPLGLLSIIREIVHKIESSAYLPFSIIEQTEASDKEACPCRSITLNLKACLMHLEQKEVTYAHTRECAKWWQNKCTMIT